MGRVLKTKDGRKLRATNSVRVTIRVCSKVSIVIKSLTRDAGASGLHSHAGAWERGKFSIGNEKELLYTIHLLKLN